MKNDLIISHLTLRRALGILGITLPLILLLGDSIFEGTFQIQCSISHYYYTRMRNVFVGVLWAFGLFLFSYKGYEKKDEWISDNRLTNIAGLLAIMVAILPTLCGVCPLCVPLFEHGIGFIETAHLFSAGIFFLILGYLSLFHFSKSNSLKRNRIYRITGIAVWASIGILMVEFLTGKHLTNNDVFVLETVALIAFGTSWLVKGKVLKQYLD